MDTSNYLDALRRDSAGLLAAARDADPATTIEACPAWTPIDLVWHIGEVHHFWATVVGERLSDWKEYVQPERPATEVGTYAFAEASARRLGDVLSSTDPATSVWTWSQQHDVLFVIRRMAQETAVHRVDAERASGCQWRVEPVLAADGIDEFLVHFLPDLAADAPPLGGRVHLHCSDVDGEWTVSTAEAGAYVVTREHAKGDVALRGDAHDLLMVLWRRAGLDAVTVFGDRTVAERLLARTSLE
jgi:uncharacterized protein (TIGR03083 family)